MDIYVASSWRNTRQPDVVAALRAADHKVYDFRNPTADDTGFHWSEIDPKWQTWNGAALINGLKHPLAKAGFAKDMDALDDADAVVMVLPCGASAHLELGHATALDKRTAILLSDGEPELMYRMADELFTRISDLVEAWKE